MLTEHLYDQNGIFGHVAEDPELTKTKLVLRRCRLAKLFDTRFTLDRGIHLQYLLDLIEDRRTVEGPEHGLVPHGCIAAGHLTIIKNSPEAIARLNFTKASRLVIEGTTMSESQKSKSPPALKGGDNLEDLLLRLQKHLSFTSDNPDRDLEEIKKFVEEASVQLERREQALARVAGDASPMSKEELMSEPTTAPTAEDSVRPARSTKFDELLRGVVDNPECWLSTPTVHLGGRRPLDLVGTEEEYKLTDLLEAVDQGLF